MKVNLLTIAAIGLAVALVGTGAASAESPTHKLGRGVANTFLGVFEIPNQMIATYDEYGGGNTRNYEIRSDATVRMLGVGTVRGFREAFRRTAHGVWDTVTFLSPSAGLGEYRSRIQPEFISMDPTAAGGAVRPSVSLSPGSSY